MTENRLVSTSRLLLTYPQCPETKEQLLEHFKSLSSYGCCIISEEEHHETDGKHLHAFLKFDRLIKIRINSLKTMINYRNYVANIEFVKNSKVDISRVVKYVIKDGNYLSDNCEVEELVNTKSHNRKYNTREILETPIEELIDKGMINPRDYRAICWAQRDWKLRKNPGDSDNCRGIWLHGPAGCGKSTWARAFATDHGGMYEKAQNKWFDGYNGEKCIVLDDLDTNALNHYLKIWADKYACKGEVKGGTVWLNHDYFIVTSNYSIHDIVSMGIPEWKPVDHALEDALDRRFRVMDLGNNEYFSYEPDTKRQPPSEPELPQLEDLTSNRSPYE